jgi:N-acetylglutamate synthase-like GNAT family acetyltransferase
MIRPATINDSGPIANLMTQLGYPTSETEMAARLLAILPDPGYHTCVAERDGKVVGMAGLRLIHLYDKSGLYGQHRSAPFLPSPGI